jgi:hypothetical protein
VVQLGPDEHAADVRWRIPGQGKSVTTRWILNTFAAQGLPALVVDFHGDMAGDPAPGRAADVCLPANLTARRVTAQPVGGLRSRTTGCEVTRRSVDAGEHRPAVLDDRTVPLEWRIILAEQHRLGAAG